MRHRSLLIIIMGFILIMNNATGQIRVLISEMKHPEISGQFIYSVSGDAGKRAYATRNHVVIESEDGTLKTYDSSNSPLSDNGEIKAIALVENDLWVSQFIGSKGQGIFHYQNDKWSAYRNPDTPGFLNNYAVTLHVDKDNFIWIGHLKEGLSRYIESVNPVFKNVKISHLYDVQLMSVFMQTTHLWVGTQKGIVRYRSEIESRRDLNIDKWIPPEFPAREVFSICDYTNDRIVAGTSKGIAIYDNQRWSLIGRKEGIKGFPVKHLARNGKYIWLGTPSGLQLWSEEGESKLYTTADGLPSNNITALSTDENNNLLVGTAKGVAIIRIP